MRTNDHDRNLLSTTTSLSLARLKTIRDVVATRTETVSVHPSTTRPTLRRRRGLLAAALAVSLAVAGGVAAATLPRGEETHAVQSEQALALRNFQVVNAHRVGGGVVVLPATLDPYQATAIFARTSGYLKAWHVDIGDHVAAGQLLAELDTPELDQELRQFEALENQAQASVAEAVAEHEEAKQQLNLGRANIERAEAQLVLAKITYQRNEPLAARQAISTQELDESRAMLQSRQAEVSAAKADLAKQQANLGTRAATIHSREATLANASANAQRLRELQGFRRLVAPFAGVITRREAEVGMLVTAGTTGQTALFDIAQQDRLRVQVAVPQSQSAQITVGDQAAIVVPEHPGQTFLGTITRTAGAIDQRSRTLNVEIELPNSAEKLLPGAYAEVRLAVSQNEQKLRVPASTLLLKSSGTFVVAVDRDSSIRLLPVKLGRDHGLEVEIAHGLTGNESLVVNPPDDLSNGERVTFAVAKAGS